MNQLIDQISIDKGISTSKPILARPILNGIPGASSFGKENLPKEKEF